MLLKSRKKIFNSGVVITAKKRFCNEYTDKLTCNRCNNQINENKEIDPNLNEVKRQPPNKCGQMAPHFKD